MAIDPNYLFKLPWTAHNNPNGWIEPTTYCQIACPGCYRGLDKPNPPRIHEDLSKLKREVDTLIRIRNIKILSIAGGEPLLYPHLNRLIEYAKKKGLKTHLVTNAVALTKDRLISLRNAGLSEILIHLASYQNRPDIKPIGSINKLRDKYCSMFKEVGGIELDFIMTVNDNNFKNLSSIFNYFKKNTDIISHIYLTLYRDISFENRNQITDTKVTLSEVSAKINRSYQMQPCAYLGKTLSRQGVSWLLYIAIFHDNKIIGYINNKFYNKLHKLYYDGGKYSFPTKGNKIEIIKAQSLIFSSSALGLFTSYLKSIINNPRRITKPLRFQGINVLNTPQFTTKGWDICDGCPDAILYKNKLVPSCLLERVKMGEKIYV